MNIVLKDYTLINSIPRRLPLSERYFVEDQIDQWLNEDIIESTDSDFSSPLVLVRKKDRTLGLYVDYRRINKIILRDCLERIFPCTSLRVKPEMYIICDT